MRSGNHIAARWMMLSDLRIVIYKSKRTESIAVGFKGFVEATKEKLGIRAKGHKVLAIMEL